MNATTFIYCLCEPGTKVIRYFGKANDPQDRLKRHLIDRKKHRHLYSSRWIRGLQREGKKPDLHILCAVPGDDFSRFEKAFIALGKQLGFPLTNLSDGGEGVSGMVHTPESKARQSIAMRGKKWSAAHRAKFSKTAKGKKQSPEHVAKRIKRGVEHPMFGKSVSPEHRAKLRASAPLLGVKLSQEVIFQRRKKRSGASSRYVGVYWSSHIDKWVARINEAGKLKHLGGFSKEVDAATAYDAAADAKHGKFAKINFTQDPACFI